MNILERAIWYLSGTMETPKPYGVFHVFCVGIIIFAAAAICHKFRDSDDKVEKRILLVTWITLAVLEIYKQLLYSCHFYDADHAFWDYQWYAFPFQFCSSPLYVLPFAAFLKNEKARDVFRVFLATFSLFAGLSVMAFPGDVFSMYIGISIQTTVHHGAQVVIGVYLGARLVDNNRMTLKNFFYACGLFLILTVIALGMNLLAPLVTDEVFNMFYIGPYFPSTLMILRKIYPAVPYPLFFLIYVVGFSAMAFLVYYVQKNLRRPRTEEIPAESIRTLPT